MSLPEEFPPRPSTPAPRAGLGPLAGGALGLTGLLVGVAVAWVLWGAEKASPLEAAPASRVPVAEPDRVADLSADHGPWKTDPATWTVRLTWSRATDVDHHVVRRGGDVLDDAVTKTSFMDETTVPGTRYRYDVLAIDAAGNESKPARARVVTPELATSTGRVAGNWVLSLRVISSSIGAGRGDAVVTFDPACGKGPCDARFVFRRYGNAGSVERAGASYRGSGSGVFLTRDCHGGAVSATVTLTFHVTASHVLSGQWRATRISGTLDESVPSVSNCLSAHNEWSFLGRAQS